MSGRVVPTPGLSARTALTMAIGISAMALIAPTITAQNCTPPSQGQCTTPNCNGNNGTVCCQQNGPDVIVGGMPDVANYAAEEIPVGSGNWYDAFSFGTDSCNIGHQNLQWYQYPDVRHPAIAQNMFRYKVVNGAGRFEQLGQSWLKHGFTALTQNICGCYCNGTGGSQLGIGCSDPYSASLNGGQSSAGPKWQVDASSGVFPARANPPYSGTTGRRLRVKTSDLEIGTGARYFAEAQYVCQDDAAWGNKNNNASFRECFFTASGNNFSVNWGNPTSQIAREKPAIMAWKSVDPAVTITNVTVPETPNANAYIYPPNPQCCSSALVMLGAKATNLGNGLWRYEYAIQNLNSHRSIASFSVPVSSGMQITNVGFHDVDYHSNDGENSITRDGTDWPGVVSGNTVKWETVPFATNNNSNALRWGTLYNFRFDANSPPTNGDVTLGTYRVVGTVTAASVIPTPVDPPCPADITGDGMVNVSDLLAVINAWGPCGTPCPADINADNVVNVTDLLAVINAWGPCP